MDLEEIKCPMCHNVYDEDERAPMMLVDCGHSVCWACIQMSFRELRLTAAIDGDEDVAAQPKAFVCPEDQ